MYSAYGIVFPRQYFHNTDAKILYAVVWLVEMLGHWFISGFFVLMSLRWLLTRQWSDCFVSPTYCSPHFAHWIMYTRFDDLHVAADLDVQTWPVVWLFGCSLSCRIAGQVLQPRPPQGRVPTAVDGFFVDSRLARTRRFRRFLGRRNATSGASGKAATSRSETFSRLCAQLPPSPIINFWPLPLMLYLLMKAK